MCVCIFFFRLDKDVDADFDDIVKEAERREMQEVPSTPVDESIGGSDADDIEMDIDGHGHDAVSKVVFHHKNMYFPDYDVIFALFTYFALSAKMRKNKVRVSGFPTTTKY